MKKILVIAPLTTIRWGTKNAGGVDSVCQMLVKQLQEYPSEKFFYRIVAFDPSNTCTNEGTVIKLNEQLEVVQFNIKTHRQKLTKSLPNLICQLSDIRKQISEFGPDLIHSHLTSWTLALGTKVPIVATMHNYKKICRHPRSFLNNLLYEKIIPFFSNFSIARYTCVSGYFKNEIEKDISKKIDIVYNPVDNKYLLKDHSVASEPQLKLVTCSLLTPRKGIHHMIEVVKKLKDKGVNVQLNVIGPKSDADYLVQLNTTIENYQLSNQITFSGKMTTDEIIERYLQSDVGLFLSAEETFGLVPIEMLATGLPVICTDTGIISDLNNREVKLPFLNISNANDYDNICHLINTAKGIDINDAKLFIRNNFSAESIIADYEVIYTKELL